MKTVRSIAGILFYLSRIAAIVVLVIATYAFCIVMMNEIHQASWLPIRISGDSFQIYYPFTKKVFLLGDYKASFLVGNLATIFFYGVFLWMLGNVFDAFRQSKLFTRKGVVRLSRFYIINLVVPFIFIGLLVVYGSELVDIVRIIMLHLVIGVFAFFMAAIFRHGVVLQEEQDLTF
ncbi:MAG: DUF2975 domain-containing protein [Flavisolibacter sp.]|jgi:hypothetical protein